MRNLLRIFVCFFGLLSLGYAERPAVEFQVTVKKNFDEVKFISAKTPDFFERLQMFQFFTERGFDNEAERVEVYSRLYLPKDASADSPKPAMIVTHGLGGMIKRPYKYYRKIALKAGFAVLEIDHYKGYRFKPKELNMVGKLLKGPSFESSVIDLYQALRVLEQDSRIDSSHIVAMGVSRGAIVTDLATRLFFKNALLDEGAAGFAGYMMISPHVFMQEINPALDMKPMLYLMGKQDYITPYKVSWKYTKRLQELDYPVRSVLYNYGFHAFPRKGERKPSWFMKDLSCMTHVYNPHILDAGFCYVGKNKVVGTETLDCNWGSFSRLNMTLKVGFAAAPAAAGGLVDRAQLNNTMTEVASFLLAIRDAHGSNIPTGNFKKNLANKTVKFVDDTGKVSISIAEEVGADAERERLRQENKAAKKLRKKEKKASKDKG